MASGADAFLKGRQLLNSWLLTSGSQCIWELKQELGATVRDVLEHPLSWHLTADIGISLPPLSAFYHDRLHVPFTILHQPPSWAGLLDLVSLLGNKETGFSQPHAGHLEKDVSENECGTAWSYTSLMLEDSLWMLLMDFPAWLHFASISLFQTQSGKGKGIGCADNEVHSVSGGPAGPDHLMGSNFQAIAASYVAWLFSPQDQKLRDLVVRMLTQMAQSWLCIENEMCPFGEDRDEMLAVKRQKLMDVRDTLRDESKASEGKLTEIERLHNGPRKDVCGHGGLANAATEAVQKWLVGFEDCCGLLDKYSQNGPPHVGKKQSKRRPIMGAAVEDCPRFREQDAHQPEVTPSECSKSSSFFDTFPLVALSSSHNLQSDAVVHLILHVVMMGSRGSSMRLDVRGIMEAYNLCISGNNTLAYQEARKGLACREPSHRTEDFRDMCGAPFCSAFSRHTLSLTASGAAKVFRFLEILDLLENSLFLNGCKGLEYLGSLKKRIARQLQMCISRWCRQADSSCLNILDDLQHRAALWARSTGLESEALRTLNGVLQNVDILIASSVVGDPLLDSEVSFQDMYLQ